MTASSSQEDREWTEAKREKSSGSVESIDERSFSTQIGLKNLFDHKEAIGCGLNLFILYHWALSLIIE